MAEQRSRPATSDAATDDALATINEHLARFFQHADGLLVEWKGFGDQLRASMDAQVGQLNDTVATAVTDAGRAAAQKLDHHIESSMANGLAELRREVESLARLASQTAHASAASATGGHAVGGGTSAATPRRTTGPLLWAVVTANVMLAVLIGLTVRNCQAADRAASGSVAPVGVAEVDAAVAPPITPEASPAICGVPAADIDSVCTSLAKGYDAEAAGALIAASAGTICDGDQAALVTKNLLLRLSPPEPPETKPTGKAGKSSGKKSSSKKRSGKSGKKSDKSDKSSGKKSSSTKSKK